MPQWSRLLAAAKARTVALEQRARTQLSSTAPTETVEGEGHAPAETQVNEVSHACGKEAWKRVQYTISCIAFALLGPLFLYLFSARFRVPQVVIVYEL
jgi:hypothetical protein